MKNRNVIKVEEDGIKFIIKPDEGVVIGLYDTTRDWYLDYKFTHSLSLSDIRLMDILTSHHNFDDNKPDIIRATAKCDPRDEFDAEIGKRIVRSKIDYKLHIRKSKYFSNMINITVAFLHKLAKRYDYHLEKAENINNDYWTYFMKEDNGNETDI